MNLYVNIQVKPFCFYDYMPGIDQILSLVKTIGGSKMAMFCFVLFVFFKRRGDMAEGQMLSGKSSCLLIGQSGTHTGKASHFNCIATNSTLLSHSNSSSFSDLPMSTCFNSTLPWNGSPRVQVGPAIFLRVKAYSLLCSIMLYCLSPF